MRGKEKMLVTSILSFPHSFPPNNAFYSTQTDFFFISFTFILSPSEMFSISIFYDTNEFFQTSFSPFHKISDL